MAESLTEFGKEFVQWIMEGWHCFFRYEGQVYCYCPFYEPSEEDEDDRSKYRYEVVLRTVEENPDDDRDVWHETQIGTPPLENFLKAKLFGGKTIIEIADDIEWAEEYF